MYTLLHSLPRYEKSFPVWSNKDKLLTNYLRLKVWISVKILMYVKCLGLIKRYTVNTDIPVCCIVSSTRVKINYDIFLLWFYYDPCCTRSFMIHILFHVCVLLGSIDWHGYITKFGVTRGGCRAFWKPTKTEYWGL